MTSADALAALILFGPPSFMAGWMFASKYRWPTPHLGRNRRHGFHAR